MSKLVPIPVEVTAAGETFKILPFGFGMQVKAGARIAGMLASLGVSEGDSIDLPFLLEHGSDVVLSIVADAVGKPRAWLDALSDFDEGLALMEAVWSVNAEILTKKVLPAVAKKLAAMPAVAKKLAAMSAAQTTPASSAA